MTSSPRFSDIQTNAYRPFIEALAQRGIISGFPNGTFRPNQPVSRAEFAAIIVKAFPKPAKRKYTPFVDVPPKFWAATAIQKAYETEFLSGYPGNRFRPEIGITRMEVFLSLVTGLGIKSDATAEIKTDFPKLYEDAAQIPTWAADKIAIATDAELIINYPNLKQLRPQQSATRAEVAAFVYQALLNQNKVPPLPFDYIVVRVKTLRVSHTREFRGVWVTTGWNIDFPSKRGLTSDQQKAELLKIFDQLQFLNFNALILQIRPAGDALYASQLEPWSEWLSGTQGQPPDPYYDPLQFAVTEGHKRNIEIHAWFNPYRARTSTESSPNVSPHIAYTHPEYVYPYGGDLWMDPGAKIVQDLTYNVILDVVRRYDIDGVHLDDYFYPYPVTGQTFPDEKTYAQYQATGGKLSLSDWRRENVNQMMQRLYTGIRATKPNVKFGISPFGIYRPGQPPGSKGLDQYEQLYADPKKWLEQGWVDYMSPQLYWRIDAPAQSYPVLLKWWTENNPKSRHLYPGNRLSVLDGKSWTIAEYEKQVEITRNAKDQLSLGNIFYSMKPFSENRLGVTDSLKASTYSEPALAPNPFWLDATSPPIPGGVKAGNGKITWKTTTATDIRSWTLYKQTGNTWKLLQVLNVSINQVTVEPGTYALCAVDNSANESLGVVVRSS